MSFCFKLILWALSMFSFFPASAGYVFAPAITYYERETHDTGNFSEARLTTLDLRVGYLFDFGLYVGGLYSMSDEKLAVDVTDFVFGPTVGYKYGNVYALLTYHLIGDRDLSSAGYRYSKGSGVQVDIGYLVPVTETFSLGPQLSYKNVKYSDVEIQGTQSAADYKWNGITPYFSLWFHF